MEKFYVIDTWNGQGYSDSDLLQTFDNKDDATKFAFEKAVEMYIATSGESLQVDNQLRNDDNSYISVTEMDTDREDSGCIHVLKGDTEIGAILIRPDTCSADLLDMRTFRKWIEVIKADDIDKDTLEQFDDEMYHGLGGDIHTNSHGFCKFIKLA